LPSMTSLFLRSNSGRARKTQYCPPWLNWAADTSWWKANGSHGNVHPP
jgi:hypothetical protein